MSIRRIVRSVITIWFLSILGLGQAVADESKNPARNDEPALKREQILVIGKVSEDPNKHYKNHKPIGDYVVSKMADLGIMKVKVLFAKDNTLMISYLKQGKIDWITETPFSAVEFVDKGGAEVILRRWKKGVPEYHTVFFTRKDSDIDSIYGLKGKTIAFEDPGSTSGFLLPAATLIDNGFKLVQLATPREKPPAEMIGYVFSKNEINLPTLVYKRFADAGAFSNLDWEDDGRTIKTMKQNIRIFYQTGPLPRSLELIRGNLSPEIKKRLKSVLLNAHKDPEANQALKSYKDTKLFDEITPEIVKSIEYVRSLSKIVKSELM